MYVFLCEFWALADCPQASTPHPSTSAVNTPSMSHAPQFVSQTTQCQSQPAMLRGLSPEPQFHSPEVEEVEEMVGHH